MYNFTCRASQQTFNVREFHPRPLMTKFIVFFFYHLQDQNRVRYGIQKMQPLDFLAESQDRFAYISQIRSQRT